MARADSDAVDTGTGAGSDAEVELTAAESRSVRRRADRDDRDATVKVRGGTPVTPIGGPEEVDARRHPRATTIGLAVVGLLFLLTSFAVGTSMREGERAVLAARVPVPRLDGSTLEDATRTLEGLGLLVAVEYQPNEAVPEGVVFGQRPVAGSKLEVGTEVTVVVSDGPAGVKVPDVTGFQGAEAVKLLEANGLVPVLQPAHDEEVRPGEVLRTDPAAGNRAVPGATVAVVVSDGPAPRQVPAISGQPVAEGFAALGRAGVGLGKVTATVVEGTPAGVIVSTDPPAGTAIPRDHPVAVVVTESVPSLTAPSVTGLLKSSAAEALADSQLSVSYRNQTVPFDDSRAGRVIAQSIPAGTAVSPGTPFQLIVAVAAAPPTTTTVPGATTTTSP